MKLDSNALRLYLVTDRSYLNGVTLPQAVEQAILGGVTFVQLREKDLPHDQFLQLAFEVKEVTKRLGVPFVINDNVEVAKLVDADGVHVGQTDLPLQQVRALLGAEKMVGVSVQTKEQAILAERDGADYLGVGAVFPTATKPDADALSPAILADICKAVTIPTVAIGGICKQNVLQLKGTGLAGVAVVSAILAQQDIKQAAEQLLQLAEGL